MRSDIDANDWVISCDQVLRTIASTVRNCSAFSSARKEKGTQAESGSNSKDGVNVSETNKNENSFATLLEGLHAPKTQLTPRKPVVKTTLQLRFFSFEHFSTPCCLI